MESVHRLQFRSSVWPRPLVLVHVYQQPVTVKEILKNYFETSRTTITIKTKTKEENTPTSGNYHYIGGTFQHGGPPSSEHFNWQFTLTSQLNNQFNMNVRMIDD